MPLAFHSDREAKYDQQVDNARKYIVPFIASEMELEGKQVLEIGCGEGGILEPFLERGCRCVGVDMSPEKIAFGEDVLQEAIDAGQLTLKAQDIYEAGFADRYRRHFDLILLKDTIEHIYDQEKLLKLIRELLAEDGCLFIGFPPWFMPYGGHQQMADSRLGKLPYYHLLPRPVYKGLLKAFGESERRIEGLMEVVDTRLTIQQVERLLRICGYRTRKRQLYLINPIYEFKFGLKPRKQ